MTLFYALTLTCWVNYLASFVAAKKGLEGFDFLFLVMGLSAALIALGVLLQLNAT